MSKYQYITVDVFTSEAFKGNPLAVFSDARDIPEHKLQQIAKEFNYSEVTFVYPPKDNKNTARVRIFTPTNEVPFAGHPNIGTAFVLARQEKVFGKPTSGEMTFEEDVGLVDINILKENDRVIGAQFSIDNKLTVSSRIDLNDAAKCANIDESTIVIDNHFPIIASVGLPFTFIEVDNIETLRTASSDVSACLEAENKYECLDDHFALFLYTKINEDQESLLVKSRMFAPINNIIEDPATGSASAALTSYLLEHVYHEHKQLTIHFVQGEAMGRESRIQASATKSNEKSVGRIKVSGNCAIVMSGHIIISL